MNMPDKYYTWNDLLCKIPTAVKQPEPLKDLEWEGILYQPEQLVIFAWDGYFQALHLLEYFPCGEVLTFELKRRGEWCPTFGLLIMSWSLPIFKIHFFGTFSFLPLFTSSGALKANWSGKNVLYWVFQGRSYHWSK